MKVCWRTKREGGYICRKKWIDPKGPWGDFGGGEFEQPTQAVSTVKTAPKPSRQTEHAYVAEGGAAGNEKSETSEAKNSLGPVSRRKGLKGGGVWQGNRKTSHGKSVLRHPSEEPSWKRIIMTGEKKNQKRSGKGGKSKRWLEREGHATPVRTKGTGGKCEGKVF